MVLFYLAKNVHLMLSVLLTADGDLKDGVTYQQMQVSFAEKGIRMWVLQNEPLRDRPGTARLRTSGQF